MSDTITSQDIARGLEALQRIVLEHTKARVERKFPLAEAIARLGEAENLNTFGYEGEHVVRRAGAFES